MKLATLGPEGTFSHQAALTLENAELIFAHSIEDVFDLCNQGLVEFIFVPFENSVSGTVSTTLDQLIQSELKILQEIVFPVQHHLASFINLNAVEQIYTHPHTFEQCRQNLRKFFVMKSGFNEIEIIFTQSNALSAQKLLDHKETAAALIPEYLANKFEIPLVKEHFQDEPHNETRFFLLGSQTTSSTGKDRSSLMFCPVENRRGLLGNLLNIFSKYHLNLTKIESKPNRKKLGEYFFYMDFEGHIGDNAVQKALEEAQKVAPYRFFGSYPRQF